MALKIRGNSQILDGSIDFRQMQDLTEGTILGRAVNADYAGKAVNAENAASAVELGAEDIRRISGLWEIHEPTLKGLNLNKHEGTGGNLDVEGTGNIDGDFTILKNDNPDLTKFKIIASSGNLSTLGTMTSQGDIKLTDSSDVDQHHLKSDGSLTSLGLIKSKDSIEINPAANGTFQDTDSVFSVDNTGDLVAAGIGDFGSTVTAGTLITLNGDTNSADNGKISAKLLTLDAGGTDEKMIFTSAGLEIDKKLTVKGDLEVLGTTTTIDTQQLIVEDSLIFLAKGNDSSDALDIGFIGQYNNGSNNYWTGLIRDSSVENGENRFKLFHTGEDLSQATEVNTSFTDVDTTKNFTLGHLEVATLTAVNLNGELSGNASTATKLAASVNFSIGDELDGDNNVVTASDITASAVSFDGSGAVVLTASLDDEVIDVDNFQSTAIVKSLKTDTNGVEPGGAGYVETLNPLGDHDVDTKIPTAKAVKAYVDSAVTSGGFESVSNMDLQMGHGTSFHRVYEKTIYHTVENYGGVNPQADEAAMDQILLNGALADRNTPEIDSNLEEKIMVFVNGQKVRYTDNSNNEIATGDAEFFITDTNGDGTGHRSVLKFGADIIELGDEVEVRYYVKYPA